MSKSRVFQFSDVILTHKDVVEGRKANAAGLLADYSLNTFRIGWPRVEADSKQYLNIQSMTIPQLQHHDGMSAVDAVAFHKLGQAMGEQAKSHRLKSYVFTAAALGTGAATFYLMKETEIIDSQDVRDMAAHYQRTCDADVKQKLGGAFNSHHPTDAQTTLVNQCIDEYVAIHTTPQPMVGLLGIVLTAAFVGAAYFQRRKNGAFIEKETNHLVRAAIANGNAELCYAELTSRRHVPEPQ